VEREAPSPGSHSAFPSSSRRARLDSNTTKIQTPAPCFSSQSLIPLPLSRSPLSPRRREDPWRPAAPPGGRRCGPSTGTARRHAAARAPSRSRRDARLPPPARETLPPTTTEPQVRWSAPSSPLYASDGGRACAVFRGLRAEMEQGLP
jgi:hypothetical protein